MSKSIDTARFRSRLFPLVSDVSTFDITTTEFVEESIVDDLDQATDLLDYLENHGIQGAEIESHSRGRYRIHWVHTCN